MSRLPLLLLLVACASKTEVAGDETGPNRVDDTGDTGAPDDTGEDTHTGTDSDTGADTDTAVDTAGEPPVLIQAYEYFECDEVDCLWTVEADGIVSKVEMWLLPTGHPDFEDGCTDLPTASGEICGVWAERHDAFRVVDEANQWGGMTRALTLLAVDTPDEQAENTSTLYSLELLNQDMTWLFVLTDGDGVVSDCATNGHDPYYFASVCANRF